MITEVEMGKGGKEGFPGAGVFKALYFPKMGGDFQELELSRLLFAKNEIFDA